VWKIKTKKLKKNIQTKFLNESLLIRNFLILAMEKKNTDTSDCGCDPYLLSLVETTQGQESAVRKSSKTGLLLASITGGAAIILSAVCFPFVSPALRRVSSIVLILKKDLTNYMHFVRLYCPMFQQAHNKLKM
jgi:hypothetical protein